MVAVNTEGGVSVGTSCKGTARNRNNNLLTALDVAARAVAPPPPVPAAPSPHPLDQILLEDIV